ncbi:Nitrite reductase [NAD(P)H] [Pseudoprimorskyibacter insulae]|uniref:Nitrite reductase [NAD(P)H] n=2 Tax=Pseudoprimorskyibacter insulae TaxID=1695997 RepID=A0A2R8AQP2_9RHOB|nr:Nitrite reductase [NAD(P)H] [Pseudoprimorskyibacter insulae]
MRTAQELAKRGQAVHVLTAEAFAPYNRVQLTPLLGGDVQFDEITLPLTDETDLLTCHWGQTVARIDREARQVITRSGDVWAYSKLVLATGSRAFVPGFPGTTLPGVFTFRTADDASALMARSFSARRIAVIGGGLLGLEAARGMRRRGCDVTLIEHESHLMPRQLDLEAGSKLAERICALGVDVMTGRAVREITGTHRVDRILFADGSREEFDTVIICTGVRANTDLAQQAGIAFSRGITVGDQMQTSDPLIYAVGECCEHRGRMYGLVGPGYEQAKVAAEALTGGAPRFAGAIPATKLKVIGAEVFSVGEIEQLEARANVRSHVWRGQGAYRRIFIERGALVGAVAVGGWSQASRMQDAAQHGDTVYPWMVYRFLKTGLLWTEQDLEPAEMPASAILCNCTGVTYGQARAAITSGASDVPDLGQATGAGTICGTCRPVLEDLLTAGGPPKPMQLWKPLLALSGMAAIGALIPILFGRVPLPDSYDAESLRVWLWRDGIVKQWSGFILLGITLAAMILGLRKRIRLMDRLGGYDYWRLIHIVIGLGAVAALFAHTGFSLGNNLNLWLGASYAATLVFGAVAGLTTGGDHELRARGVGTSRKPPRKLPTWLHIIAIWPLPVLILIHVLASYAF